MAIKINRIDDGKGIELICAGEVSGSEIMQLQRDELDQALKDNILYILADYCGVTINIVDEKDIEQIASNNRAQLEQYPNLFIVAVVPHEIHRILADMWIAFADVEHGRLAHFESRQKAKDFIRQRLQSN
jgi:hypothetical protein